MTCHACPGWVSCRKGTVRMPHIRGISERKALKASALCNFVASGKAFFALLLCTSWMPVVGHISTFETLKQGPQCLTSLQEMDITSVKPHKITGSFYFCIVSKVFWDTWTYFRAKAKYQPVFDFSARLGTTVFAREPMA